MGLALCGAGGCSRVDGGRRDSDGGSCWPLCVGAAAPASTQEAVIVQRYGEQNSAREGRALSSQGPKQASWYHRDGSSTT